MSVTLLHSPADVLRWLLVARGMGSDPGAAPPGEWPVYVGREPDAPDSCITLYDTAGRAGDRTAPLGERDDYHGVQLRFRCADHASGFARASRVARALDEDVYREPVFVGSDIHIVHSAIRAGTVLALGREAGTARQLFTLNVLLVLD